MAEFKNRRTGFKVNNTADNIDLTNMATTADVEEVADDLETLGGTVTTLSGSVDDVAGDLETLEGTVETLSGSVEDVAGDVETLEGTVTTLSGNVETLSNSVFKVVKSELATNTTYTSTISLPTDTSKHVIVEVEYIASNALWNAWLYGKSVFAFLYTTGTRGEVYNIVSNDGIAVDYTLSGRECTISISSFPATAYVIIKTMEYNPL